MFIFVFFDDVRTVTSAGVGQGKIFSEELANNFSCHSGSELIRVFYLQITGKLG